MKLFRKLLTACVFLAITCLPSFAETGASFLAENAKRAEVTVTNSGLQYEVLRAGNGRSPSKADQVTVHYHGTLVDGRVFDSSYNRNKTATFPLNRVIAGWTEGVQLMKEGSKWRFYIPSKLGYGKRGTGKMIRANETLIFDVELIKVL